jgi:hypothetical protein
VTTQSASPAKPLIAGSAIVALGVLVALVIVLTFAYGRPTLIAFAVGGIVLLIPTLVVRDQRAYWLFLLVLSMPFDIGKQMSKWLVDPVSLSDQFGPPPSGIISLDFYLTDAVLFAMLLPWLAGLCLRRDSLYFPKIAYFFLLYLAWALIVSLIEAESFYLSILQWCREILYFLSFLYLVNNVATRSQIRAVVLALLVGLVIASGTVNAFFVLDIRMDASGFSGFYKGTREATGPSTSSDISSEPLGTTRRSTGIFGHAAIAAYYLEFTLLIALAHLVATERLRDRILFGLAFISGFIALYLTFSRSGLVGFAGGSVVFVAVARWSGLISQRAFAWCIIIPVMFALLGGSLLIGSFELRPKSVSRRVELLELALDAYRQQPILAVLGAGLNNGTIVIKEASEALTRKDRSGRRAVAQSVHNQYAVTLMEVGLVGFLLIYIFYWKIVMIALHSIRSVEREMKVLLAGIVGSVVSIAIHGLGDGIAGHATNAMLWLFVGLIVAITRRVQAERALPARVPGSAVAR